MNIKKLIIPVVSLIAIIIALIIGVVLLNNSENSAENTSQQPTTQTPVSSPKGYVEEADRAYLLGDIDATLSALEKAKVIYQDQNDKQSAAEITDHIASIKSLRQNQTVNTNADKTPAPLAED